MIWLLSLLVVFWKPIYYLVRYAIATRQKDDISKSFYLEQTKQWFKLLWVLVKPDGKKEG